MPQPAPVPQLSALQLADVTKTYAVQGREGVSVQALAGASLAAGAGEFVALVGPSGCGKSTLLHCAAGLDKPTTGRVSLLGTDITALSGGKLAAFRARQVGFIFQDYNLISSLSAADNVGLPAQLRGQPPGAGAVAEALARVGLGGRARLKPRQLSGGEKQRVAIARVLAARPPLIFADEPTGALDIHTGAAVLDWLRTLAEEGSTVLMVTHDVNAAARADRVAVMQAGQVVAELVRPSAEAVAEALQESRAGVAE